MVRFGTSIRGGSIVDGPTVDTRSQLRNPGSAEPPLTCGSSRSAPSPGARPSGTQGPEPAVGTWVGNACGVKPAEGEDPAPDPPPSRPEAPAEDSPGVEETDRIVLETPAGAVVCGACEVLGRVGRPIGRLNVGSGRGECDRCASGAAAATALDGANVADAASSNVAAPAHATNEAIGAIRPRAERGRAGEGGRDTGRRPSVRIGDGERRRTLGGLHGSPADRRLRTAGPAYGSGTESDMTGRTSRSGCNKTSEKRGDDTGRPSGICIIRARRGTGPPRITRMGRGNGRPTAAARADRGGSARGGGRGRSPRRCRTAIRRGGPARRCASW